MPFFTYAIVSKERFRYIGHTSDLERRLEKHNTGKSHATKHGYEWRYIYAKEFTTRSEAMKHEKWLKSGVGRIWLTKNIAGWSPP
ncbi:MAG TPA: GIY-YIG nuclease family protein [Bacteroidota bacterium]